MGMLTGSEIVAQMVAGNLKVEGYRPERLNPNSLNLCLSPVLGVFKPRHPWTPWRKPLVWGQKAEPDLWVTIPPEGYKIRPGWFYLGSTVEHTETESFVPRIDGRSTGGRLSLHVHCTAGFGDIGFCGTWTLEIYSIVPVIIFPFSEVCQISYEKAVGNHSIKYHGRYQGQKGVTPARPIGSNGHL